MTESQLRYLRHLIHPSEWHMIRQSMTKIEASEKIEQCIRKNESDLAANESERSQVEELAARVASSSYEHDTEVVSERCFGC